mmetsp:Transcript_91635/g.231193  ORF Transcript_91635/g.231193 Transcript_91635/m.231193 type:complete len:227 (-) Transcript_91635:71-751(-)
MCSEHDALSGPLAALPRSESMDVNNDPRFFSNNVISKRLAAFQTICVVSVLMVNLSVKQMFLLEKSIDITTATGVVQYTGFCMMCVVFLLNLTTVIVLIQQLFMTYRLLTVGPTGFEVAKSYYLNPNVVSMRHGAVKGFFFSLPLFIASSGCMVWTTFKTSGTQKLAIPVVIVLFLMALLLWFINAKHSSIFKERYNLAKLHEEPLLTHVESVSHRSRGGFFGLDV